MNQETFDEYVKRVIMCMGSFQFIEEALKMFLSRVAPHEVESNQKAPLGKLIRQFKLYCEDQELIEELNNMTKRRNDTAHISLLLTSEEFQDRQGLEQKIDEAIEIDIKARGLLFRVIEHVKRVDSRL
jgi:hypothetical protein